MRTQCKISSALVLAVIFGPLTFLAAWLYEAKEQKGKDLPPTNVRAFGGVIVVIAIILSLFYGMFVANFQA